jgi:hypothetical protein
MRSIEASTDISATPERVWDVTRFDDCPACVRCPASPPGSGRAGNHPQRCYARSAKTSVPTNSL